MNENSQRVLEELTLRKASKKKLAYYLGMFEFSLDKKLSRGLTDEETKKAMSVIERRF